MKKIELFGKELLINDNLCVENPEVEYKFNPALRLYIKITDSCNANCAFCANKGCEDYGKLDLVKLKDVIEYLKEANYINDKEYIDCITKLYNDRDLLKRLKTGAENTAEMHTVKYFAERVLDVYKIAIKNHPKSIIPLLEKIRNKNIDKK